MMDQDAPCANDPEVWFSSPAMAKALCQRCPVKAACLAEADRLEGTLSPRHIYGVWGGLAPAERAERRRRAAA